MPERKLEYLGNTKGGIKIFLNPSNSHIQTHQQFSPMLKDLIIEALPRVEIKQNNEQVEVRFLRTIGITDLVKTNENDEIIFGKRKNRKIYSRFVKNKNPEKTNCLTLVMQRINLGYELLSAWLGPSVPPFPGDRREWPSSKSFWNKHALIFENQSIQKDTITNKCPWK